MLLGDIGDLYSMTELGVSGSSPNLRYQPIAIEKAAIESKAGSNTNLPVDRQHNLPRHMTVKQQYKK